MNKDLLSQSKEFLDNFNMNIDFDLVKNKLTNISKIILKENDCNEEININFIDKNFGILASTKNNCINFNKLRIETMIKLEIDSCNKNHIKNLNNFYKNFNINKLHDKYEIAFYEFIDKYLKLGLKDDLKTIGSYKYIKYELLETIFHETRHIVQNSIFNKIKSSYIANDSEELYILFCSTFNEIYSKLIKNSIPINYIRENYRYPIEFDARYYAMKCMEIIRENFYSTDVNFSKHILISSVFSLDIDSNKISQQIFNDYVNLFLIYKENFSQIDDLLKVNALIMQNKKQIIQSFKTKFEEILNILKYNKI